MTTYDQALERAQQMNPIQQCNYMVAVGLNDDLVKRMSRNGWFIHHVAMVLCVGVEAPEEVKSWVRHENRQWAAKQSRS